MQQLIQTTFIIILLFSLLNLLINVAIYTTSKRKLYIKISLFWATLIINFLIQAQAQTEEFNIILSYGFAMVPLNLLATSSLVFLKHKYPTKQILFTSALMIILTISLKNSNLSFTIKALPFAFGTALPLLYTSFTVLILKRKESSLILKFLSVILFIQAIHCFNFALFRLDPGAQLWGWLVAYALYQLIAGVLPALTLDSYYREIKIKLNKRIDLKTAELTKANESLTNLLEKTGYLFRTLTHDISTPLMVLGLAVKKIEKSTDIDEKTKQKMKRSYGRMMSLVAQVKDLERIEFAGEKPALRNINLGKTVTNVKELYSEQLTQKNLTLEYNEKLISRTYINVEESSFSNSVLPNIVSNCIKFSHEGGAIKISAQELKDENKVCINIEDSGIGIPDDILKNMFNFKSKTTRNGTCGEKGTGFGMPILKETINLYNGSLKIETNEETDTSTGFTRYLLTLEGQIST